MGVSELLKEATRIKTFDFTVTFNNASFNAIQSPIPDICDAYGVYAVNITYDGVVMDTAITSTTNVKFIDVDDKFNDAIMDILFMIQIRLRCKSYHLNIVAQDTRCVAAMQ